MSLTETDMELLERKFSMYIILALDKKPMSTKTDIMRMAPGNEKTKYIRINELIAEGFIEYVSSPEYSSKRLKLTEDGKELAARIKKVRLFLLRHKKNSGTDSEEEVDDGL